MQFLFLFFWKNQNRMNKILDFFFFSLNPQSHSYWLFLVMYENFIKFLSPLSFKKYFLFLYFSLSAFSSFFLFPSHFFFLSLIYSLLHRSILDLNLHLYHRSVLGSSSSPSHAQPSISPLTHLLGFFGIHHAWLLRYPSPCQLTHSATWPSMGPTYFTIPILLGSFAEWTRWPTRNSGLDSAKSSCIFFFFFLLQ